MPFALTEMAMKKVRPSASDRTSEDQDTLGFQRYQNPTGQQLLPLEEEAWTDGGSADGSFEAKSGPQGHRKGTDNEIERYDSDRRPRAGGGLCRRDSLTKRRS